MVTINTFKKGSINGIETVAKLCKIIIPVNIIVVILKYTGIFEYISVFFKPFMSLLGLTGESAVVLILGNGVNLYAAIGAMTALELTVKQITILSTILSFSHSLPVETAVTKNMGISIKSILFIRIGFGLVSGFMLNIII